MKYFLIQGIKNFEIKKQALPSLDTIAIVHEQSSSAWNATSYGKTFIFQQNIKRYNVFHAITDVITTSASGQLPAG